jgi:hypothetical protein
MYQKCDLFLKFRRVVLKSVSVRLLLLVKSLFKVLYAEVVREQQYLRVVIEIHSTTLISQNVADTILVGIVYPFLDIGFFILIPLNNCSMNVWRSDF